MSTVRIRIQNNGDEPVQGFQIRYHVSHPVADLAHPEVYYPAGVAGQWLSEGEGQSVMVLDFPGLVIQPGSIYPDNAGLSIGLHAVNWGPWNKSDDYSQPAGATFLPTDRIEVFSEGKLLSGPGTSVLPGCPIVEFLKIQGDSLTLSVLQNEEALQANLEVRSARDTQLLPSELFGSTPGMPDTLSIAFPVQQRTQGEVWVACQGQMLAYFAFGAMPDLALQATESGLWDSPAAYVATNNTAFGNEGLLSGDRFVRKAGLSGRSSADWMLYRFWQDSSETALPIPRFPAQGVVLLNEGNSDSLSFEWEAIANAESYALRVVRDSVYGDTVISTAVTENKVRLPMMTEGNYVWWAEPQFKMGLGISLPSYTNTLRNINPLIRIPTTVPVPPGGPAPTIPIPTISPWTRLPVGEIVIHGQGSSDVKYEKILGVPSIAARKDTRMLDLKNHVLTRWDISHMNAMGAPIFYPRDEEEDYRCWAAAAQMLNRHFGGTLSQDEIKFHIKGRGAPEKHFPHGSDGAAGVVETFNAMAYALNLPGFMGDEIAFLNSLSPMDLLNPLAVVGPLTWGRMGVPDGWAAGGPSAEDIMVNIRIGTPLAIAQINGRFDGMHMMVIDGVRLLENGRVYAHFLNTNNDGGDEWRYIGVLKDLKNMQDVIGLIGENMNLPGQVLIELRDLLVTKFFDQPYYFTYFIPPANVSPRNMDPRLFPENDYDGDGLTTFDEEVRFGTDPHNPDSDFDGVEDKNEIGYYVREKALADRDGDGLRAELDPDADGDGDCDGNENTNGDYYYRQDLGEMNAMDPLSAHPDSERRCRSAPVALLALDNLSMNDRSVCSYDSWGSVLKKYCPVASLGLRSSVAVQLGVESQVGHVLAGSAVWLRSRAQVHGNLRASGGVIRQDETPVVSGSVEEFDSGVAPLLSPYQKIGLPGLVYLGTVQTYQVPSGKTAFLKPGGARKNVVVSSGATLILMPGSYDFGSLDVQSGGVVQILPGSVLQVLLGSVDITLAGTLGWNGAFQGDAERFAQRFKVTVQGDETIFLNGSFAGHLTAPRAHVVLGQAAKEHAGQIAARRITVHQGARFHWVLGN